MSESSKMGLFGSKDDNTETSDEKKQPVKSNDATQGHSTPYNIDSDSETYDTEALSIMDINDIIGIQAETAGDSTLESEIAALSEVITDIKSDEVASGNEKTLDAKKIVVDKSDTKRDIGSSKDKGSEKDSPKEDICSQADDNKSFDSAGMAGINKSLQLIGEAYISDDSQDTETDEIPDTTEPKPDTIGESITVSKNENAEATAKNSNEKVASVDEQNAPEAIIAKEKSAELDAVAVSNKSEEIATNPLEQDLKSMQIEKSTDSTDSPAIEVLTKQFEEENKTEYMDVDSAITEDIAESVNVEKSMCNAAEEIENVEKIIESSKIELTAVETENLAVEPVNEVEVPMEVDQPIEEVSEKVETEKEAEPLATKDVIEHISESSDSVVTEETGKVSETICQQEEIKKLTDEVFDNTKSSADNQLSMAETSNSGKEEISATKIIEEELSVPKIVEEDLTIPEIVEEELTIPEIVEEELPIPEIVEEEVPIPEIVEEELKIPEMVEEELKIPEIVEEELKVSKIVEEELKVPNVEVELKVPKVIEEEFKQSSSSPKGEETIAEKIEMETDDSQVEESIPEQVEANNSVANITESIVETKEQTHVIAEDKQPETSTEKVKLAEEISLESLEDVGGIERSDITFIEHVATSNNEPMEVDNNADDNVDDNNKNENDTKGVNSPDLLGNSVDTVEPVADIVAALKKSEGDKLIDTATDSPVSSLENIETAQIEAHPDITVKEISKNKTIASPSKLSENYADIDESISNITLKEFAKDETSVASKLFENSAEIDEPISNIALKEVAKDESSVASELSVKSPKIFESALVDTSKESASDKTVVSELKPPEESSIIDEAMETEDITLKESLKEELVVAELSKKSSNDAASVSDVIPREISIVGNEETALEDEKMEVDAGMKKKIQEVEENDICRQNEASQETEESSVSTAEEVRAVEESTIIEKLGDSDRAEDSESTGKSFEDLKISKESATGESSEIEAIKSIDETDEARQNSKDEENVGLIYLPQAETFNEKIQDISTTQSSDNATAEVAEVEKEEVESMSKKEENEPLIDISQAESSIEKIHEIDAIQTTDNSTTEEVEDENKEVQSESKEEENEPLIAIPQAASPAEKIHEIEATRTLSNDVAEVTKDDKEEAVSESMEEENVPLIATSQAEYPAEKIHEIETTGTLSNDVAEVTKDDKEEAVSESMEEENVPLISIPQDETSTEKIHDIETKETPGNTVAEDAENETDEVKSELMEEEIEVPNKPSESSAEKSCAAKATNATDEPASENTGEKESFKPGLMKEAEPSISTEIAEPATDIISEIEAMETIDEAVEEEHTINTRAEEPESLMSAETAESSSDKIHEIETIVTPVETMEEDVEKAKETTQSKVKADETVALVSIEKPELLIESIEMKILEAPLVSTENNVEVVRNESEAITKEEEKESPASAEILKPSTTSSEMEIAKSPETIIEDVISEKEAAKSESQEISTDNSSKSIPVIQSTVIADEAMITDVQEVEKSISESKETEKHIATEITEIETPERCKTDNLEKNTEEDASTCEKEIESQFEFPKPEAPQHEASQIDLSSASMNPEDAEDEEDPVEEEMNLSLDPEISECQDLGSRDDDVDEAQRIGKLALEAMPVDSDQMEDQTDINLSLEQHEKIEEMSSIKDDPSEKLTAEVSVDESSMTSAADKPEQSDERLEKSPENDDENSKDIMSTIACESEIFHDEQSQSTQEMMDSILETDSSNFNKILDDEEAEIVELADKLPLESEELLNKALDDPMASQNIDSLEGLLDLDLIQEGDESTSKSVDPIVAKVMKETEEDIETKDVDVSLLLEETDQSETVDRDDYVNAAGESSENTNVLPKVVEQEDKEIAAPIDNLLAKTDVNESIDSPVNPQLETAASPLADNVIEAVFDLPVEPNTVEADELMPEDSKLELAEDLLMEIAVDEEKKMALAGKLLLETTAEKDKNQIDSKIDLSADLLLDTTAQEETKDILPTDVLLTAAVEAESDMELVEEVLLESPVLEDPKLELSEDISMETVVRDQVLTAAAEIEGMPPSSEISELESAVKFLQESEEQDIDSPLVLSPKIVDSVVEDIARVDDVGIFVTDEDICEDPSELVAELENIIPDPIAISEAEIISEAVKLESERKSKLSEEAKLESPLSTILEDRKEVTESTPPPPVPQEVSITVVAHPETPKTHREPRDTVAKSPKPEKIEQATLLKKSAPIPKISILEERLKEPPKIEIPSVSEVSRICEIPTTPKTSLLIQRDAKLSNFQKMLESPKATDKTELKIVDTPRKDADKHDFENVGSPRIILKIAKSAIADCAEPRSPKSPKIRSATNSPNPDDSPGQKLGKIKLKLSKGGHPSIISNENVEEVCGQWHTEGTSSLSPLGMKIKFSKTGDASIVQTEKHEPTEEAKEPPKHKFEEAKRTESPIGMKIKFSKTGDASIVQQDSKESSKHKDKLEIMQGSPKRNESPLGMKIKFSKSGDASIIQPEKSESSEDHREISSRSKDKLDVPQDAPRRTESPLGMKFKLFKTGDASIVASEIVEDSTQETKRTESPLGMKIKLSKTRGSSSKAAAESNEDAKERLEVPEVPRRTESPLGMKIKFSKTGDASIIHLDDTKETAKHKERAETNQDTAQAPETPIAVKIKVTKSRETSALHTDVSEEAEIVQTTQKRTESSIGMKFKLSKTGDASIVLSEKQEQEDTKSKEKSESPQENARKPDSAIGMKIKFSKTGDASIIQSQLPKKSEEPSEIEKQQQKTVESPMPMKIKLQKSVDITKVESEKKEKSLRRKETDSPLEMKIKLSKTGHPTIVACDNYGESSQRTKDTADSSHKNKETTTLKEMPGMKMLKTMHSGIHGNRAELTIEPVQLQSKKSDVVSELSPKRKDVTISPVESKKAKLEAKLSQMLPEVTIQPIKPREQKQIMFDAKASSISRQQMNVISQEISITQVRSNKAMDLTMTNKLKSMLAKTATTSANPDCEIIEHRPELIIVNENSNSSQDVMIIEEVPALREPEVKVPKKRGRPRRNPLPVPLVPTKPIQQAMQTDSAIPRDPLALDDVPQLTPQTTMQIPTKIEPINLPPKENERPKRSCSRQKSYAPPRRGRGRGGAGRGKRKMEVEHMVMSKKPRIDQDLTLIEQSTTALITIDEPPPVVPEISHSTSELYKALRQPPMDHKMANAMARVEAEKAVNDADLLAKDTRESLMDSRIKSHLDGVIESSMKKPAKPAKSVESVEHAESTEPAEQHSETFDTERKMSLESLCSSDGQTSVNLVTDQMEKTESMIIDDEKTSDEKIDDKTDEKAADEAKDIKDTTSTQDHQNWLTPSSKKQLDGRNEGNISSVQVIDEETRMSAESSSRSQTPARNMTQAPETIVNEESQGSVLSTATTESEKVKVKNRRMEISFDPDEGPFTVDKIAEYEWPLDPTRKSETFMIQEQISHYLGVKSFKRKYPDLNRRMVDMEERNYLRENALVSEAMCDMGLTAVCSSEVLDVMCNDFPDQYEEYRKYIREKQMKEHSKKQKELTAAANAEKNRIDLAEMAVQSALSWNVGLNKSRRESRKCSLDLQTFTIHVPKKQQKVEEESRQSHYPVALIPGQYTDYYREYTPAELRYYPLNTVLYGPMKPNERKLDSQSEGSQSDSDSDSSSDDSSSSSSDGTQDTEESQSTMDEVDAELSRQKEDIKSIKCKMCLKHLNKFSRTEVLIQCGTCNGYVHPSCIDLTLDMVPHIQAYAWQCTDCKTCAQCHDPADEDKMLFCDMCDRGYHIYCVGLRRVPQGRWHCQECAVCASCGSREAGGANSDRNSVAQWQHEYKKGDKNTRVYVSTLCVPCSKLWRKGRYCPHCSRCHTVPRLDLEANLVHCSACDKYLHLGCVETKDLTIDRKNYLCDFCQPSRPQMVKPLVSKVFRT